MQPHGNATGGGVLLKRAMNEAHASTIQTQEQPAAAVRGQKRTADKYISPSVYMRSFQCPWNLGFFYSELCIFETYFSFSLQIILLQ